ncbi:MAG: DUF371 domain-containing protein [Nitrososphaera sp.]|uniref:DUF371 domain-containing protein n=1 Tax=Nitrososphaera sp. TaxID=1971748 RepID=UPI00183536E2|nr:DUF371 domain-containing protein [Nitrososphaera sp.]NWG37603.1 DUF371 domain-containing protein [Nitrososphaera sp.]
MQEEIAFFGHPNVQSFHARTVEITKEEHLTLRGDCIIGVRATKACADLEPAIRNRLMKSDSHVKIEIVVGNDVYAISGSGDERLTLKNTHDIVIRKTNFVCPRTLSVRCDRASSDIPRRMVQVLKDPATKGLFRITVE